MLDGAVLNPGAVVLQRLLHAQLKPREFLRASSISMKSTTMWPARSAQPETGARLRPRPPRLVLTTEASLIKRAIRGSRYSKLTSIDIVVAWRRRLQGSQGLHAAVDAEQHPRRRALSRRRRRSSRSRASNRSLTRCSRSCDAAAPAVTSSSTRPRRSSRSTSTPAARRASTISRTPRSAPTLRPPTRSPASCACAISPASSSSTSSTWRRPATTARSNGA